MEPTPIENLTKEYEDIIFRAQKIVCHDTNGLEINSEKYRELLRVKEPNIYYKTTTVVAYTRKDKPDRVYLKTYDMHSRQVFSQKNNFYCSKKTREIRSVIFNLKTNNFLFNHGRKTGRGWVNTFTTNTCKHHGSIINTQIKTALDEADKLVFYTNICAELGITARQVKLVSDAYSYNEFYALVSLFLIQRRGFDIMDLIVNRTPNFSLSMIKDNIKLIQPGDGVDELLRRLCPTDEKNLKILREDENFRFTLSRARFPKVKQLMELFDLKPEHLRKGKTKWGNHITDYTDSLPYLKILKDYGFSYEELKDVEKRYLYEMAATVDYFSLLGLRLKKECVFNVKIFDADVHYIKNTICVFLGQNSHFLPANKTFARKLSTPTFKFEPIYYYSRVVTKSATELYAPYRIINKELGVVGIILFSKMSLTACRSYYNHISPERRVELNQHLHHKAINTKLMEYLDYSIKYNRIELQNHLKENLSEDQQQMIIWN